MENNCMKSCLISPLGRVMQIIIKDPVLIFFNALKKESDKIEGEVCEVGTVLPCF